MLVAELYYFVVDVVIDVRLGYGEFKGDVAGSAEFCLFVSPKSGVGCNPSRFQVFVGP